MKPTRRTILSLAALASLAMLAPSHAGTATAGTLATFDELADLDLSGDFLYALNTGQDVYYGNPVGDPYAGGTWGSGTQDNGQNLTVGDASFKADMWNINDEGRNYNKNAANTGSDAAQFGTNDDWRFFPERGANNTGTQDGGINGVANYASGYQSQNAKWQSPYEGKHDHNTSILFSGDSSTDAANLRTILSRSGTQNLGGYNGSVGERDMTYDLAVSEGATYKLQVLFFKTGGEPTSMRIDVEGVNVADDIDLTTDTDGSTQGLVYTNTITAGDDTLQVVIGRQTDGGGSNSVGDVNAITLELIADSSSAAKIRTFGQTGFEDAVINDSLLTIDWTVPYGTVVENLAPTYTLSSGATCVPDSGTVLGTLTEPYVYTVKSLDETVTNPYTVTVTVASSFPGTATFGTLATFDELADLDLSGTFVYALNTGQDVYHGNPVGDPYAGGTWGSGTQGNGQNLTVGDASFMADMWNINDEGRNWNKDDANPNSDAAVFGTNDDWRFFPERGANNTGNDDGGIAGLANYVSGYQSQNAKWQSPYEGKHDHDTSNLFSGDSSTDATNLRTILSRSGTQNLGGYSGGLGVGERDITYDFDVIPGERYKLQILFYKNSDIDEGTTMRIDVEDVNVADKIDMSVDTDGDTQGLVYTYEFTAGDDTLNIDIGKRTDNADGGTAGRTIADVNAITLEGPASDFQLIIKPNASTLGNYDFTWDSSSNKVYDLVSNTNLDTSPLNWPVWDGRANIPSGGTTTTLENVPGGGDPTRFFAVVGKAPPPPPLVNGSFETPVGLNDGVSAALGSPWAPVPDPLPGMVLVATWNPPLSEYNLVDFPDGDNVCYVFFDVPAPGSAFGASQVLTETFAANTNYMVTVKVGRSNTYDWPGFRVVLLAGGTVLASDEDPSTTAPTAGNFINSTVSYTYDAGDVGLVGQSLEIRLLSRGVIVDGAGANGWEVDFDDVSFTATPAP